MCYFFNIMYKQRLKCILLCIHDLKLMDTTYMDTQINSYPMIASSNLKKYKTYYIHLISINLSILVSSYIVKSGVKHHNPNRMLHSNTFLCQMVFVSTGAVSRALLTLLNTTVHSRIQRCSCSSIQFSVEYFDDIVCLYVLFFSTFHHIAASDNTFLVSWIYTVTNSLNTEKVSLQLKEQNTPHGQVH